MRSLARAACSKQTSGRCWWPFAADLARGGLCLDAAGPSRRCSAGVMELRLACPRLGGGCGFSPRCLTIFSITGRSRTAAMIVERVEGWRRRKLILNCRLVAGADRTPEELPVTDVWSWPGPPIHSAAALLSLKLEK